MASGIGADGADGNMSQHRQVAGAKHSVMTAPDMRPFCRCYARRVGYENRLT